MEYSIRIERDTKSGWLCGQCEQLPEAISQGRNLQELMFMMADAIKLVLACKQDEFRLQYKNRHSMVRKLTIGNEEKTIIRASRRKRLRAV